MMNNGCRMLRTSVAPTQHNKVFILTAGGVCSAVSLCPKKTWMYSAALRQAVNIIEMMLSAAAL